jgi:hypothetical protein
LCALARIGDDAHTCVDRGKDERIREWIGQHRRCVHAVGNRHREGRSTDSQPALEPEAATEQVRRDRCERDEECMQSLGEPKGGDRVVRDEPHRRGHERVEESGEADAHATDQRAAVLRETARERGVDVFVGEVVGRQACDGGEEPPGEAGEHDPGEPDPGRHCSRASECARREPGISVRAGRGDVDCHETPIGNRLLSLERGIPC